MHRPCGPTDVPALVENAPTVVFTVGPEGEPSQNSTKYTSCSSLEPAEATVRERFGISAVFSILLNQLILDSRLCVMLRLRPLLGNQTATTEVKKRFVYERYPEIAACMQSALVHAGLSTSSQQSCMQQIRRCQENRARFSLFAHILSRRIRCQKFHYHTRVTLT